MMILYWVLHNPMGLKCFRKVASLHLGIRQKKVVLTAGSMVHRVKVAIQNCYRMGAILGNTFGT